MIEPLVESLLEKDFGDVFQPVSREEGIRRTLSLSGDEIFNVIRDYLSNLIVDNPDEYRALVVKWKVPKRQHGEVPVSFFFTVWLDSRDLMRKFVEEEMYAE
jgi:hypothetical protein